MLYVYLGEHLIQVILNFILKD